MKDLVERIEAVDSVEVLRGIYQDLVTQSESLGQSQNLEDLSSFLDILDSYYAKAQSLKPSNPVLKEQIKDFKFLNEHPLDSEGMESFKATSFRERIAYLQALSDSDIELSGLKSFMDRLKAQSDLEDDNKQKLRLMEAYTDFVNSAPTKIQYIPVEAKDHLSYYEIIVPGQPKLADDLAAQASFSSQAANKASIRDIPVPVNSYVKLHFEDGSSLLLNSNQVMMPIPNPDLLGDQSFKNIESHFIKQLLSQFKPGQSIKVDFDVLIDNDKSYDETFKEHYIKRFISKSLDIACEQISDPVTASKKAEEVLKGYIKSGVITASQAAAIHQAWTFVPKDRSSALNLTAMNQILADLDYDIDKFKDDKQLVIYQARLLDYYKQTYSSMNWALAKHSINFLVNSTARAAQGTANIFNTHVLGTAIDGAHNVSVFGQEGIDASHLDATKAQLMSLLLNPDAQQVKLALAKMGLRAEDGRRFMKKWGELGPGVELYNEHKKVTNLSTGTLGRKLGNLMGNMLGQTSTVPSIGDTYDKMQSDKQEAEARPPTQGPSN